MLTSDILCEPIQIGDDEVILTAEYARVTSASQPGHWYTVANGTCDCRGWSFRHTCRHLVAAEAAWRQYTPRRVVPLTVAAGPGREICRGCGKLRQLLADYGKCATCCLYPQPEEIAHAS